jgi:hypothetical protein
MSQTHHIHWLVSGEDRALRRHLLLGDEVSMSPPGADDDWLGPAREGAVSGGRGVLMLRYERARRALVFCLPSAPSVEAVRAARETISAENAQKIWGPFAARLGCAGPRHSILPVWREDLVEWGAAVVRVRRARHSNPLIDRLVLRERAHAVADLEDAARGCDVAAV